MRQPYTYTMPEQFLHDAAVPLRWKLYAILNGFWMNGKTVYSKNAWFSETLKCDERTIQKCLADLETQGLITRQENDKGARIILPGGGARGGRGGTPVAGTPTINSNNIIPVADATKDISLKEVPVSEDGDELEPRKKRERADLSYLKVFELWGKYPASWKTYPPQIEAAKNLMKQRSWPAMKRALELYNEHKDDKFCPRIYSPYTLDSKWSQLYSYLKHKGV